MKRRDELHVVVGAGQVGWKLVELLLEEGHRVRVVRRSAKGEAREGLEWARGDIGDVHFAKQAFAGAEVVYHCANPAEYHKWEGVLEPMFWGILEGAKQTGAKLVTLDNLYMYGRPSHQPFDESTPMRPCSEKGKQRAALVEELFAAHERGDVRATSGRASDFFGPASPLSVLCSPRFFERLAAGRSLEVLGDPDLPRSYSYTPDVARGLMLLGASEEAYGRAWHLPVLPDMSSRKLLTAFARAAGVEPRLSRLPNWMFRVMGLFSPMMRAMVEMLYQWEIPYAIDDSDFRETFHMEATPLEIAVGETLATELPKLALSAATPSKVPS